MGVHKVCSIPDCGKSHQAKGFCEYHYNQIQRHGQITPRSRGVFGEGHVRPDGYRAIYSGGTLRLQHRVIMECTLGRQLLPHENIHHVNGDKLDNRPENLEVWTKSHPSGQRVEDRVQWAVSFLSSYPEQLAELKAKGKI